MNTHPQPTLLPTPTAYWLGAGEADSNTALNAFDGSLLAAGVGDTNLVKMSSILPPGCRRVKAALLPYGTLVPVAYAQITSDMPGEIIAAGVAVGVPADEKLPGLIMEYSARGHREDVEAIVRSMVETGFAMRSRELADIHSTAVQHKVEQIGSAFACVVLWHNGDSDD
jgi:arginine decarboxylase